MSAELAQDTCEFALFDLGTQCVAVPSASVVQAIAYPSGLSRLPRSKPVLAGVFVHRGQVLPLLDLRQWMDGGPAASGPQQVLMLKTGAQQFAIAIDALRGLLRVPPSAVQKIHHDDDPQELFHSVVRTDDGQRLISLLDPQRLAQQVRVWAGEQDRSTAGTGPLANPGQAAAQNQTATCAVVRLDNTLLALPANGVGEVLSGIALQRLGGVDRHFLGMAQWRGQEVPLLDLAQVLELPPAAKQPTPWVLVLRLEGRALAFCVQELCAVRAFDKDSVQQGAVVSEALRRFSQGSCLLPDGQRVYLLDPQALLDASPLSNGNDPNAVRSDGALHLGYRSRSGEEALVVFRSRQLWAASMGLMREILSLPAAVHNSLVHDNLLPASMEWRGQPVPLCDLRKRLQGQTSSVSQQARIIVIQEGARTEALLVESVDALIPGHTGSRLRFVAQGQTVEMVTVGSGGANGPQSSYQLLDLRQLPVAA